MKLFGFCLSIAYITRRHHPYIESLPTLLYVSCTSMVATEMIKMGFQYALTDIIATDISYYTLSREFSVDSGKNENM